MKNLMDCFVVFATLKLPRNDGKISQNLTKNAESVPPQTPPAREGKF
ncbi:hypothetical protein [Helicobacter sp. 23-1045]